MRTFCSRKGFFLFFFILSAFVFSATAQDQPKGKPKVKPGTGPKSTTITEDSASPTPTPAPTPSYQSALAGLRFREIGPATMGGRIDDIEVVPSDSRIIYVATAAGGILKSVNGGTSWSWLFDKEAVPSVGDIAITPSNPSIIWAGTGESNNRQSSSWGNGIYKSMDAGKTWKQMGLAATMHIARIVVHPTNPDIVYVAATGNLWGSSPDRGVYRTMDGGKSWQLVLKVNADTGATDIAIDPESPTILYAAMYQRRRTVFGFNGSGEGSALYKTNDGGDTWTKITKGMPYDTENAPTPRPDGLLETGRNAIAVYPKDTNIVYALVEHANGGVFRSNDKGETWTRQSNIDSNPRPMYFSQIRIDPNNDQRLWIAGVTMQYSDDGGKTWSGNFSRAPHADTHAIWIDPNDSNHLVMGNDGGINITYDRGKTWDYANTVPLGQFYEVGADNSMPYKICGGLQDNNAWCGPSMSFNPRGITNDDWYTIGGGDGFYAQPDPNNPDIVYTESQDGNVLRRNVKTGESKSIRPREEEGEAFYRFQWNSPILISSYDSNTIYFPGNFVFKSTNRGDSWIKISPDLTTNVDRNGLAIMGKVPDKNTRSRHDGVQQYPTITSITESPVNKSVLWAGTDDGNLQVTRDSQTWKNVVDKIPGLPKGTYVSRVVASRENEGTAYATFDGHRMGDFKVYVYMTSDFGETWRSIASNLPQNNGVVSVIREHPRNTNLLFVGTEFGLFASYDRGANWSQIKQNLPTVPVDDILIHPRDNDLILGTHGRSIWVMDDITALEQMNQSVLDSKITLFDSRPTVMWRAWSNKPLTSDKAFLGQNPPNGAMINFYLKDALADKETVAITIQDAAGATVRTINCTRPNPQPTPNPQAGPGGPGGGGFGGFGGGAQQCNVTKGINRYVWDLRSRPPGPQIPPGAGGPGGGFGGGLANLGLRVEPGDYTVKIKLGDKEMSKPLKVVEDPRINFSADDRAKKRAAMVKLQPFATQAALAQTTIVSLRTNVNAAIEGWKRPGTPQPPENVKKAADDLLKKIDAIYVNWGTPPSLATSISSAGPPLVELPTPLSQRAQQLLFTLDGTSTAPTDWELAQIEILSKKIPPAADEVRKLVSEDLAALNALMQAAKMPYIQPPGFGGGGGGGRPPVDNDDDLDNIER
ncbi:MAG: WD40/YVTN/BNR-like repeat-containing protein [Pyrinomonadaceae bacterium]